MPKSSAIRPLVRRQPFINAMIYSWPGIGKSTLIGTGPKTLVLEAGHNESMSILTSGHADNVDIWEIKSRDDLADAHQYLRDGGTDEYEWCWLDSASGCDEIFMTDVMTELVAKKAHRDILHPDKAEFGTVQSFVAHHIRHMTELPINFGVTAHVMVQSITKLEPDGEGGSISVDHLTYMPQIQGGNGKQSQKICAYFDVVGFMDIATLEGGKQVRSLLVQADGAHIAKDRFGCLANNEAGDKMLEPTIPKIMSRVKPKLSTTAAKATGAVKKAAAKKTTAKKAVAKKAVAKKGTLK